MYFSSIFGFLQSYTIKEQENCEAKYVLVSYHFFVRTLFITTVMT